MTAWSANGEGEPSEVLEIVALDWEDPNADDVVVCNRRYVDCSAVGGYDPADPCK